MYSLHDIKKNYVKILIIALVVLIGSVPFYFYSISVNVSSITNQKTNLIASEIKNTINMDLKFLSMISSSYALDNSDDILDYFKDIIFVDNDGKITNSLQNQYIKGINISNEDIFKKAKFYRKPVIKYVVQSIINPQPSILMIIPREKGYIIGVVSNFSEINNKKIYYILTDSYKNIDVTNFEYLNFVGNLKKYFSDKDSGITFINRKLYYYRKTEIMDNLYLYVLENIKTSIVIITLFFVIGILFAIFFLTKFLNKNVKLLADTFDFINVFSEIFTEAITNTKKGLIGTENKIFVYEERATRLRTNILEFNKMKNSFIDFFKLIIEEIEEVASRDEEIAAMNQDLESMYTEVENYSNQLGLVIETIFRIDTELTVEEFLNNMHNGFVEIFDVETLIIFKIDNKIYKVGSIIKLSDNIIKIPLVVKFKEDDMVIGNIFISSNRKFNNSERKTYDMFAKILSIFITHKIRSQQIEELYLNSIEALANAVEIKDKYTRGHTERVAKMSVKFANYLGIEKKEIELLYRSAILHDIGKIGIPDAVLNKPGKLSDEEYNIIKEHPLLGYNIIMEIKGMEEEAKIIKHHHERWDGNGYPDGLSGNDIPYLSRLIAIIDSYDAMHSDRSYRKALPMDAIKNIFMKEKGKQWDPELTDEFLKIIDNIDIEPSSNPSDE